jgi:hypothetical protein
MVSCANCSKQFLKKESEIRKGNNNFCCCSCSVTYSNLNKKTGTRRSKLESWLEIKLQQIFPTLEIYYGDKTAVNSELDIYIPSLNLAFELNGIFHYEPIFGSKKLEQIKNNDKRKYQACSKHHIELYIIDTRQQKKFKEKTSTIFLEEIKETILMKFK